MKFLTSSFSPAMLAEGVEAVIVEVSESSVLEDINGIVHEPNGETFLVSKPVSRVGHAVTAKFLSMRWGVEIPFSRENITLCKGDECLVCLPMLRFDESREYTHEEIHAAKFRFFSVQIERERK